MALRSIAARIARRTRTSSNGFFLLLMVTMVLAREPPISTANLGSALNCARLRAAATRGKASTSPESSDATCADGSLMKRITTLLSLIAAALRYSGHLFSVIDEPLAQAATVNGPGANRLGAVGGHALRLDDRGGRLPEQERQVRLRVLHVDHDGVGVRRR